MHSTKLCLLLEDIQEGTLFLLDAGVDRLAYLVQYPALRVLA
jgi:hypothetical protein